MKKEKINGVNGFHVSDSGSETIVSSRSSIRGPFETKEEVHQGELLEQDQKDPKKRKKKLQKNMDG